MSSEEAPDTLLEQMQQLIDTGQAEALRALLAERHPADVAAVMGLLAHDERQFAFDLMDDEHAGQVLEELDEAVLQDVARDIPPGELSDIAESMAPEEAADLLGGLPDEQAEQVLELMEPQEQQQVQDLLQYPEDSVGGRMRPVLAVVPQDRTAAEAIDMLRTMPPDQPLFYVYVVDEQNRLVGAVSLRGLVTSPPGTVLKDICDRDVIRVPADADQEALAAIFSKYELLAVPVVDAQGRLLGRVTVDDIFDVIEEEVTEDAYKMAGLNEEELGSWSPVRVALARLPWLLICLGGTMLTGVVAYVFRFTIKETIGIVAFIPAIGAMGGNMGLQTSTVAVRGMATGQLDRVSPLRHILKEIGSALLVALTCGSVMGVVARFWVGNPMLGVVVGVAMFAAMSTAAMLGAVLPLLLRRLSIDPAIASGPLLTTVNDSLAQFMYLGLATLLLVKHH